MTIEIGKKITYKDLTDKIYELIINKCDNIDKTIPINGQTYTISSTSKTKCTLTINDNKLVPVSASVVKTQLDSFLSSRGIKSKENEVITFKGMMNFYANISSFLSAKMVLVGSSFRGEKYIIYNASATNYTSVQTALKDKNYTKSQIETDVNSLLNAINSTSKVLYPATTITYTCSSSSSSSSSSSCSSSSSMFIAYMEI